MTKIEKYKKQLLKEYDAVRIERFENSKTYRILAYKKDGSIKTIIVTDDDLDGMYATVRKRKTGRVTDIDML
jgi:hypothetical protein